MDLDEESKKLWDEFRKCQTTLRASGYRDLPQLSIIKVGPTPTVTPLSFSIGILGDPMPTVDYEATFDVSEVPDVSTTYLCKPDGIIIARIPNNILLTPAQIDKIFLHFVESGNRLLTENEVRKIVEQ